MKKIEHRGNASGPGWLLRPLTDAEIGLVIGGISAYQEEGCDDHHAMTAPSVPSTVNGDVFRSG